MRPSILHIGGTIYWTLFTRNPDTMVLKDADSTPTVAVRKNGAAVGDSVTITKRSATTGIYDCSYNPAAEVEGDVFTLEESATVTGTTTAQATYVSSFNVRTVAVERGTDGANTTAPDNATISLIQAKTTNLPSDPADQSAVEAAITAATSPLATSSSVTTVLSRLGGWTGTGVNNVLGAMRALAAKAAALTPSDLSTGTTFDNTTDSQEAIADDITAYIASISAVAQATTGTIVGFPASLNIGDSYTDDCDASIHVFIRDDNNDPITEVGDHAFTDPDFAPELIITAGGNNGRVKATVAYVDASPAESYLKVQLPRVETLKAGPGTATMQCKLIWDGAQKTIAKQAVTWVSQI